MDNLIKVGGWLLAVCAAFAASILFTRYTQTSERLVAVESLAKGYQKGMKDARDERAELAKKLTELNGLEQQLADANAMIATLKGELSANNGATSAEASTDAVAASDPNAPEQPNMAKNIMKMFQGEKGKEMAVMSARMAFEVQYAEFLKQLALDPEKDKQVREILAKSTEDQITAAFDIMKDGKIDPAKKKELEGAFIESTKEALTEVLTPEQLAAWEQYELEKPRHTLEQSFTMQMRALAPSIDDETRTVIVQTFADEMLQTGQDFTSGTPPSDPAAALDTQMAAFERARESLSTQLNEEQLRQLDGFIQQQRAQFEMARRLFESMAGTPDEGAGNTPTANTPTTGN
jgi:hypothetical protein